MSFYRMFARRRLSIARWTWSDPSLLPSPPSPVCARASLKPVANSNVNHDRFRYNRGDGDRSVGQR